MSDFTPCTTPEDLYREGFAAGLTFFDRRKPRKLRKEILEAYLLGGIPEETNDGWWDADRASNLSAAAWRDAIKDALSSYFIPAGDLHREGLRVGDHVEIAGPESGEAETYVLTRGFSSSGELEAP